MKYVTTNESVGYDDSASSAARGEAVFISVYDELRRLARRHLHRERANHTLAPTAVVHEAYLRLTGDTGIRWTDPASFRRAAAATIRRILVEHARARSRDKRGGDRTRVALGEPPAPSDERTAYRMLVVDEALTDLAETSPLKAQLVELRFFGGLTPAEAADTLGISLSTVTREWRFARAWLRGRLDPLA